MSQTKQKIKACILAAGVGSRLDPLTETRPKPIIPIGGKPLLQHTIEMLQQNGIHEILVVVGYRKEQVISQFGEGEKYGVKLSYIEQTEFLGTGHAANLAKNFAQNDPFLLIYGDLFLDQEIIKLTVDNFHAHSPDGIICAMEVPDPTKYGILKVDTNQYLEKIVEKPPDDSFGNLANAGIYLFRSTIFEGISETQKSPRGEYELTESIERQIAKGEKISVVNIQNYYWSDVGHPWQLLDANHHYLKKHEHLSSPEAQAGTLIEPGVTMKGFVQLGKGIIIKSGTYLEGPIIIGDHAEIGPNAHIRPYSTIGEYCKIGNSSEIKNSIIMNHSAAPHLSYVGDSIIGEYVNLGCGTITANVRLDKKEILMKIKDKRVPTMKRKMGAVIGDHVSLGIQVNIMPGKKIGANTLIGSGTIVIEDVPSNSSLYATQSYITKKNNK